MDARLPLPDGRCALIDADALPTVAGYRWRAGWDPISRVWKVSARAPDGRRLYLNRLVMAATPEQVVTHVNGDGLDNRRANLRRWRKAKRRARP
jgi:hypothetical protein